MDFRCIRRALLAAACLAGLAHAQTVTPPPLPIGSEQARPEPGMDEAERKRATRAHHHKFQQKKDYTRDDSIYGHESLTATSVPSGGANAIGGQAAGAAAARPPGVVQDGKGTGPAREKTDKGASSYFFGNEKK
jgi:hypothetical protein